MKEEDGGWTCELADFTECAFKTVKEWKDKVEELAKKGAEAGAAAADAVMDAMDKPMEEMMMDPPME